MIRKHSANLVLVQGLYVAADADISDVIGQAQTWRTNAFESDGEALGVCDYELVDGRGKAMANRLLRLARGTATAVDAVEIIALDEETFRASLSGKPTQALWKNIADCSRHGFDATRSFILIGAPLHLLEGPARGQRVLWFGHGLSNLSEEEFVAHYTGNHGPLVAGHAESIGLRRYRQVPGEETKLCDTLRKLGLGQATPPSVFAELYMGAPPLNLKSLLRRRSASREIESDEKRHIDFARSMLLLA